MTLIQARLAACAALIFAPAAVQAHPHVFVDTGLSLSVDGGGRLDAVEVTWVYDEFYSLLVFEDLGLDGDMDGRLNPAELGLLQGFDLRWTAGYAGDTYLSRNEAPIALGAPEHVSTEVVDGRIVTRHRRPLQQPVAADGVTIKAYDPTYYTAYTVTQEVSVSPGCRVDITPPDLDRAYTLVEELLYAMPADQAETAYPEVGAAFADTVLLICEG
ncbi:DUF1007 family protein [Phaeobacter sp. PT47_59]|uniref:DUF1007 family protein n=1 Tax=Phaeobacter sp. PT47_59 TaxID=3029979 RepID=UPI00237FE801|nr:DUF1007 family protein [Phaeobacter sp. PT47_59]MDE4173598.1 DUF1007 family protein [Phaeobacter sp. PT47_59]